MEDGSLSSSSFPIQGAADGDAAVEDVGVDHCRADVLVAEQFLDGADVVPVQQQVRGEAMAEGVAGSLFVDLGFLEGLFQRSLYGAFREMVAAYGPASPGPRPYWPCMVSSWCAYATGTMPGRAGATRRSS